LRNAKSAAPNAPAISPAYQSPESRPTASVKSFGRL
jgi:hypothetical protein